MLIMCPTQISNVKKILCDPEEPLKKKFRALFYLKNIGSNESIDAINESLINDNSVLFKHECCYVMGQMKNPYAISYLISVLNDISQDPIVRHESSEALGNIALLNPMKCDIILKTLSKHSKDINPIVSQTCGLAMEKIRWESETPEEKKILCRSSIFKTADPAPAYPINYKGVQELEQILIDPKSSLFHKYRSLFSLRNMSNDNAIHALGRSLVHYKFVPEMSLFMHEIGYLFGQLCSTLAIPYLKEIAECKECHEIARHESIEALGSIATSEAIEILSNFKDDESIIVRESVQVALDISDYANSNEIELI